MTTTMTPAATAYLLNDDEFLFDPDYAMSSKYAQYYRTLARTPVTMPTMIKLIESALVSN
jgi:hypothetical protein